MDDEEFEQQILIACYDSPQGAMQWQREISGWLEMDWRIASVTPTGATGTGDQRAYSTHSFVVVLEREL